jgi:hypothetical protein
MIHPLLRHTKWITRTTWIAVALLPQSFTTDFASLSTKTNLTLEIQGWAMWAIVLIALWVPHPISLTASRMIAPLVAVGITVGLPSMAWEPTKIVAALLAVITTIFIFMAEFGGDQVQAGTFGNERRFVLRMPVPLVLPTLVGWLLFAAGLGFAPLIAVSAAWPMAAITVVFAAIVTWFVPRRLHQLSKRWLVRVPAGWVVHDAVLLADNVLIRTHELAAMRLAPADTEALDISGLTRGTLLEVMLRDSTTIRLTPFAARVTKTLDVVHAKALLVAPSRPLALVSS